MRPFTFRLRLLLAIPLLALSIAARAQSVPKNEPIFMRLAARTGPNRAEIVSGGGVRHSAYEVYLTNFGNTPMTLIGVEIVAKRQGRTMFTERHTGADLHGMVQPASGKAKESTPNLAAGASAVLFLYPEIPSGRTLPDDFTTVIDIKGEGERGGSGAVRLAPIPVDQNPPIVIEPPISGDNWQAANGPSNGSAHRRAILFLNGKPKIGQRYAIDWVQLGSDGQTYHGDRHDNPSYYAYDQPVRAVAAGKIVKVRDGIPENVPNSGKLATQINGDTLAGNYVLEDLGGGRFAAYAHLRPGTIPVRNGEYVRSGQIIGHLGNTGNSSEPHLHFQICDRPSFLDSQGLPFVIASFTRRDYKVEKSSSGQRLEIGPAISVTNQEPIEDELDSFGQ